MKQKLALSLLACLLACVVAVFGAELLVRTAYGEELRTIYALDGDWNEAGHDLAARIVAERALANGR